MARTICREAGMTIKISKSLRFIRVENAKMLEHIAVAAFTGQWPASSFCLSPPVNVDWNLMNSVYSHSFEGQRSASHTTWKLIC